MKNLNLIAFFLMAVFLIMSFNSIFALNPTNYKFENISKKVSNLKTSENLRFNKLIDNVPYYSSDNGVSWHKIIKFDFYSFNKNGERVKSEDMGVNWKLAPIGKKSTQTNDFNWKIYPNPASSEIMIYTNDDTIDDISIFDMLGNRVLVQSLTESGINNINIDKLEKGVYFVKLTNQNGDQTVKKLIKN